MFGWNSAQSQLKKTVKNYQRATGNIVVSFAYHGRRIERSLDRLVAEAFIENPNNYPLVNHIDGDLSNCSADNLEWIPDNRAYLEAKSRGFGDKPDDYYNVWYPLAEFPDSPYEINKMGQLRNKRTGELLKMHLNDRGYLDYCLHINNHAYGRLAHVLVARQFIPNPKNAPIVNHIDENRLNPCVDNLEWATPQENANHGTATTRSSNRRSIPIDEYDLSGHYIRTWKSLRSIYEYYGLNYPKMSNGAFIHGIITSNDRAKTIVKPVGECVFFSYNAIHEHKLFTIIPRLHRKKEYQFKRADCVPNDYLYQPRAAINYHDCLLDILHYTPLTKNYKEAIEFAIATIIELKDGDM